MLLLFIFSTYGISSWYLVSYSRTLCFKCSFSNWLFWSSSWYCSVILFLRAVNSCSSLFSHSCSVLEPLLLRFCTAFSLSLMASSSSRALARKISFSFSEILILASRLMTRAVRLFISAFLSLSARLCSLYRLVNYFCWVSKLYHQGSALSVDILFEAAYIVGCYLLEAGILLFPGLSLLQQLLVEADAGPAVALAQVFCHRNNNRQRR
jgi:hypothetical protein